MKLRYGDLIRSEAVTLSRKLRGLQLLFSNYKSDGQSVYEPEAIEGISDMLGDMALHARRLSEALSEYERHNEEVEVDWINADPLAAALKRS